MAIIDIPQNQLGSPQWTIGETLLDVNREVSRKHFRAGGVMGSLKIYICDNSGLRDIFRNWGKGYQIQITLTATEFFSDAKPTSINGVIEVEFGLGYLSPIKKTLKVTNWDEPIIFKFYYQLTEFDLRKPDAQRMWLRKLTPGLIKIIDSSVDYFGVEYDVNLNNKLYESRTDAVWSIPQESTSGKGLIYNIGNKIGNPIGIKFGNGAFRSGIWKNGVWNDGWRGPWVDTEDDIFYFDTINTNTFQVSENMWFLKIDSNTNAENIIRIRENIFVNVFISIGNVVGIDINEERYLLKDYYRVSQIDETSFGFTITIEIPISKFPLRRFEIDSVSHLIYITKNIWLGGTFLNGYFRGVWNYGLFKGFPYTTVMDGSHFISGKFDGGRFISKILSITNSLSESRQYNTGLVQFFEFFDNNISETEGITNYIDNTYQSWIDVNYYTQSFVNINSLTSIYDDNFGKKVPLPNLYGYPTLDVLSSYSKFKNTTDNQVDFYNLGTKYKIYTDYLGDNGYFRNAFNSEGNPGLDEFISAGWTANSGNFYGTPTVSFIYNSNITRKNVNRISIILATFGYNVLNNDNIQVDDRKYTVVEYDIEYYQRGFDINTGQFTNTFSKPLNLLGSNYPSINNIYRSNLTKTEYFFNKNALDLILRYNSEFIPVPESLAIFGFNFTHSLSPSGETNPSFSTTYSMVTSQTSSQFSPPKDVFVDEWEEGQSYSKYKIVRLSTSDAFGKFYISLKDNNTDPPTTSQSWSTTIVGFNNPNFESTIFEQSENFAFFTSFRINYFKFLEIDALPFFKYWDYEINFFNTFRDGQYLGLEFTKPHGLKKGDVISLRLDEKKFNPQYEREGIQIISVVDGPERTVTGIRTGDVSYTVKTNILYGFTVSYLAESGTVTKVGNRIDTRIQSNVYAISPKIEGLDENFVYLGNNQISVDRNIL